ANIINDIFDIHIDRINKPRRPLPAGKVTKIQAIAFFTFSYLLGLLFSGLCDFKMFLIALATSILLVGYSAYFKRRVLIGNIVVSAATATAFVFGAMAVHAWTSGIIPAVFAFLFHFGREIIKDMQDIEGDLAGDARTFPGKYGLWPAMILIDIIFLILIVLTILPYIFNVYGITYFWVVLLGVDLVLLFIAIMIWIQNENKQLGRWSFILKIDMFVGLIALYLGNQNVMLIN
ncbi:MAG: hypothetical protein GF313_11735, partial [Caldithrix sp.]|nr:hypothetical protein [Caldithrix sp.]